MLEGRLSSRQRATAQYGWSAIGQALSALSNTLLVVLVAAGSTSEVLGGVALAMSGYRLVLAAGRALVAEPFMSDVAADLRAASDGHAVVGAGAAVGLAGGLLCLVGALVTDGATSTSLLAFGLAMPWLIVQDTARYVLIGRGAPSLAAAVDATWVAVLGGGALVLAWHGTIHSTGVVVLWSVAGGLSGMLSLVAIRQWPSREGWAWLRAHRTRSGLYLAEYAAIHGAVQGTFVAVAAIVGVAAAGALRGAETLLGPFSIVLVGSRPVSVRRLGPELQTRPQRALVHLQRVALLTAAIAVAVAAAAALIPSWAGERLLGESWVRARDLVPPFGVYSVALAVASAPMIGLRALGRPDLLVRARAIDAPLSLCLATAGALTAGAGGAVLGLAAGSLVGSALGWRSLRAVVVRGASDGS